MDIASFEGRGIAADAALLDAVAAGEWDPLRATLESGIAAEKRGPAADRVAVRQRETAFRRERRLYAAEELRSWLAERDLTVAEWRAHVQRMVLATDEGAAHEAQGGDDRRADGAVAPGHVAAAWVAVRLEGVLARATERLLRGAAAAALLDEAGERGAAADRAAGELLARAVDDPLLPLRDRSPPALGAAAAEVVELHDALGRIARTASDDAIDAVIADRRLDWTELDFLTLVLPTEAAAREAVLCVREDGVALPAVAALAGAEITAARGIVEELPAAAPHLIAAEPGQPVGPLPAADAFAVLVLRERRAPAREDPEVRRRARDQVVEERLARRLAGRAQLHVAL